MSVSFILSLVPILSAYMKVGKKVENKVCPDKVYKFGIGGSCTSDRYVEHEVVTFMNGICKQNSCAFGHVLVNRIPDKYECGPAKKFHLDLWFRCK